MSGDLHVALDNSGPASCRGRILVVDDDPSMRKVIVRILAKLGYSSETANDGDEALAAYAERAFDLVLMDCQMPKLDGFEATKAIRKAELSSEKHIPIIALTAMTGTRAKCIASGMDEYLNKPVHPRELEAAIQKALTGP